MAPYVSLYDDALEQFCKAVRQDRLKQGDEDGEKQLQQFLASRATAQQARDSATVLQKDTGKKYGAKKIGDKEIISQKWIDNILGNIGNAIAVGDKLLKGTPESVSMAWFCVKLGLNAMQSNYQLYSLFGSGLTSMTEIMILIPHYDQLYDERQKPGFESNDLIEKLFRDVTAVYVAVLDFLFSIKRHVEASTLGKVRHAFKDFFGAEVSKFQAKQDAISVLKAKVLEDSDGAFQRRLFDQLGNVQDSLKRSLDDIHTFASTAKELAQGQTDILRELHEIKASVKPKTRWDWLKQDFDTHKKSLDPLPDVPGTLHHLLDQKHPGTTQWVFGTSKYTSWKNSKQAALLCFTGQEGVGKSIALASAVENIQIDARGEATVICFVSCATGDGKQNDLGNNPLDKVRYSLLYQVYKTATEEEERPDLLEECNKLFHHPKTSKPHQQLLTRNADSESLPVFGDGVIKLARILRRDVIFVIDAIDRLTPGTQNGLFSAIEDVIDRSNLEKDPPISVRALATCRSSEPFASRAHAKEATIDVEEGNFDDMAAQLSSALHSMPDWSTDEKTEAKTKVLEMAGRRFGYISDIAIPFLRQPFQRPLSKRLEALPEGITDSYRQAVSSMPPNYLDLLKTALTWTLYSFQPVRVKEVIEAFSGVYDGDRDGDVPANYAETYGYRSTDLELQQLLGASGPFLKVTPNLAKDQIVVLQDSAQIRKFCSHADTDSESAAIAHGHAHCARCKGSLKSTHSLGLMTEKHIHLDLALKLVRHLNNPLFQKRFDLLSPEDAETTEAVDQGIPDDEGYASTRATPAPQVLSTDGVESQDQEDDEGVESDEGNVKHTAGTDGEMNNGADIRGTNETLSPADELEGAKAEDGYDSDESKEDEDVGEVDIMKKLRGNEKDDEEEDAYDGSDDCRYEINHWPDHVREADRLWSADEKAGNQKWAELIAELDKFALDKPSVFKQWQYFWGDDGGYIENVDALHVASYLGLTCWAEHLIRDKGKDPNEFSGGRTALQAAAVGNDNIDMLRLLLSVPGADPTTRGTSSPVKEASALQEWLCKDINAEVVELFVESGVDFTKMYEESQFSGLHFFAARRAKDIDALTMIVESGGTEERPRPDINARNHVGNTPLHLLMQRRDVPVDLLKAFIALGADTNAENDMSLRPLASACLWSEPELVKILLESGLTDIDDPVDNGSTALHYAAWVGSTACVRLLLSYKAEINYVNRKNRTPLHLAARFGHKETIDALIELGSNLNTADHHGRTPFWYACNSTSKEATSTLLTALKPHFSITEINGPSKRQRTPLRLAATHGFVEIVEELINMTTAAGLDVRDMLNMQDTIKGLSALNRSAWRGELACVKLLLKNGADATLKDKENKTALMLATTQWQMSGEAAFEEIVFLLIEKDQVQAKTDTELPATAASNGSVRVLDRLYRIGADINRADAFGWTPLILAQRLGKTDVERFLKQQTAWGGTLPSAWVLHAGIADRVNVSQDGLEIRYDADTQCAISTDKPLPAGLDRYYFEVTSRKLAQEEDQPESPIMAIGFCTFGAQCYEFPGWPPKRNNPSGKSWAYHGDDGWFGAGSFATQIYGERYGPGDTVGCGVDLETRTIWYTKNGKKLEYEHSGVSGRLFPIIGLEEQVSLETNFGKKPFMWNDANASDETQELGKAAVAGAERIY